MMKQLGSQAAWRAKLSSSLFVKETVTAPNRNESGIKALTVKHYIQGSAKRWVLGCVKSPPWPEGVRRWDSRNLQGYS